RTGDENLILAEALLSVLDEDYEIVESFMGLDLVDTEYEPLYTFVPTDRKSHYVIVADFVTLEDGTGIVHIAPAFGEDDYRAGVEHDLPFIQPVDDTGSFTDDVVPWAGMFIKDADPLIMKDLKTRGLLYRSGTIVHTYPFCWRCDSPLIYYARHSWYVRTTQFKNEMITNNSEIDWHPREIGTNRLGDWLENNVDWAVSRDRYWGTPLNIWICETCGQQDSIGSIKELRERAVGDIPDDLDLHKPAVDEVKLTCAECGGVMTRTPEVIDCWFDTGSMPYAQWHWPFENEERFQTSFPADFIAEGVDQTRGWFYSLLAISTIISGTSSFKRCVVNDMVLDEQGKKMSKSVGNVVDSFEIMERFGADALRWYLMSSSPPWVPTKFDENGVKEVASKVLDTLRNTYSFFSLYANIDGYDPGKHFKPLAKRSVLDRWIVSRCNSTVAEVGADFDGYDITKAVRKLQQFILEDVSNWYVRLSRARFWKGEMDDDKCSAYSTLREVLLTTASAMAPVAPFLSEAVYTRLAEGGEAPSSVHLTEFPVADESVVDPRLESAMDVARTIVVMGRAARNSSGIKIRQPLSRLLVSGVPESSRADVEALAGLVASELNVKELSWAETSELTVLRAAPIFPALGPKHGKDVNQVADAIRGMSADEVARLRDGENVSVGVGDGDEVAVVEPGDVEVTTEGRPGYSVHSEGPLSVALDVTLTDELVDEGFAREMINKIQFMRKEAGFDVVDRINVYYEAGERLKTAMKHFTPRVAAETLAESIKEGDEKGEYEREWDINGQRARIAVERVRAA
ncbi:MAG: isoleucine--tRNA ligase, partial [Candidatus Eisenbacteria bacterium]|nr:isoleucine--tRNA ligase [Candidatus Eisenbacteria bacterium]